MNKEIIFRLHRPKTQKLYNKFRYRKIEGNIKLGKIFGFQFGVIGSD